LTAHLGTHPNLRGVNVVLIDPLSCSAEESHRYDTWQNQNAAAELTSYLQQLSYRDIIVVVSADEPTHNLYGALPTLAAMGADVADVQYRGSFAFVARKGSRPRPCFARFLLGQRVT